MSKIFSPMTVDKAREVISDHINDAYRVMGDSSAMVASEILFQFEQENGQLPCGPENLDLIEGLLEAEGGPRAYQTVYPFRMKIVALGDYQS